MTITPDLTAQILRYLPFIEKTLKQFPNLTASRLHAMVVERGYGGRADHFRHLIARHRPRAPAEAYLRLRTLPGEQCQCDWAHFAHIEIGQAKRPLMAFVMVLSWSRRIFLRFFLGAHMENFLRGHVQAFESWGSVPRVTLYDNLKSAVLERKAQAIRFNPTVLALSAHYRFEPRPVAPARGNQKGRVERAIRYIRTAFFEGRTFTDIDDLNAQAEPLGRTASQLQELLDVHGRTQMGYVKKNFLAGLELADLAAVQAAGTLWMDTVANVRLHESTHERPMDRFEHERAVLRPLNPNGFDLARVVRVRANKQFRVALDSNHYSVPANRLKFGMLTPAATISSQNYFQSPSACFFHCHFAFEVHKTHNWMKND